MSAVKAPERTAQEFLSIVCTSFAFQRLMWGDLLSSLHLDLSLAILNVPGFQDTADHPI